MDTVQVPVPTHPPPVQPVKVDPAAGVAVNVTSVPLKYCMLQVPDGPTLQLMPAGVDVTVPLPDPAKAILRMKV